MITQNKKCAESSRSSRRQFMKSAGTVTVASLGPQLLGITRKSGAGRPVVGSGEHRYEVIHDWGELPKHISYGNTHGIVEDSQGNIYVHHSVHSSSDVPDSLVIFDPEGRFVGSWGKDYQGSAHGLHLQREGSEEYLYLTARDYKDLDRNVVAKTTLKGEVVFRLGYPKESEHYKRDGEGKPFTKYHPTNLAIAANGDIYVGDGYGSSYINQYDREGKFIQSFGGEGAGPGQLSSPHGITIDNRGEDPLLLVADRSNNRLQYFTLEGKHLSFVEGVNLPCHFDERNGILLIPDLAARVTLLDRNNRILAHLGEGPANFREVRKEPRSEFPAGKFISPHDACFDREGNIFVAEWVPIGRVTKLRRLS